MLLKEGRKVAPPEDDAFDSDRLVVGPEQNNVVPHDGQPGALSDVRPELIVLWTVANTLKRFANLLNEADGAARIVLGDPVGNLFQIAFDEGGEFDAHYSVAPAASAIA